MVYKNDYITVFEDQVIKPDGNKGIYGYVHTRPTLGIVANDKGHIYLCRQERYLFEGDSWEIPRGFVDDGESPEDAAHRELKEEAGLEAISLELIGSLRLSIGLMDEEAKVFLAQALRFTGSQDQEKEISEVKAFPLTEVLEMIGNGKIKDGLTVGAILLAKQKLKI